MFGEIVFNFANHGDGIGGQELGLKVTVKLVVKMSVELDQLIKTGDLQGQAHPFFAPAEELGEGVCGRESFGEARKKDGC